MHRERGKNEKNCRFVHKKIIRPRPLGGGRRVRPPPLDPLVTNDNRHTHDDTVTKSRLYTCQNDICVTV